jgi:hypothetical protein
MSNEQGRIEDLPDVSRLEPVAVVDTNVMMDIYSPHDLLLDLQKFGETGLDHPQLAYRRARARESLLLAMHLSRCKSVTYSLLEEGQRKMLQFAPPSELNMFTTHYAIVMIWYIQPQILHGWEGVGPFNEPNPPKGSAADTALVEYAKNRGLPIITNEGYSPTGFKESGIHKKAKQANVNVMRPCDYYAGHFDEDLAINKFLTSFDFGARKFARESDTPEAMAKAMPHIETYFRHVLHRADTQPT